ncbi:DNA polymerase III subunit psi [Pantoea sp. SoEX]|nr:DNA polymerase III subunit psi [Pantoea sp. SoEX]
MGIIQYKLHRINVLKGLSNFDITSYIKLVIITNDIIDINISFMNDILHTLCIQHYQVLIAKPEQLKMLIKKLNSCIFWFVGEVSSIKNLNLCKFKFLHCSSLSNFINNNKEKRLFWKQIRSFYD